MPRPARVFIPGVSFHVFQRGVNRSAIFNDDDDYEYFLWLIRRASHLHALDVHGFATMTTHYHLIVTPQHEQSLPCAIHDIAGPYAKRYNERHKRIGPVWNGRYGTTFLWTERYWLTCLRYVELNPVAAGMVTAAEDYRWSSYRCHAFGANEHAWLTVHPLYAALGSTGPDRESAYRAICNQTEPIGVTDSGGQPVTTANGTAFAG